jgi:hypothetical protein
MEAGDRSLAASNGREHYEEQPISPGDHLKAKGASPPRTLRGYWLLKNMRSMDGLPGLATAPDAILNMTPQSHFDKDTRQMMCHTNGGADHSQGSMFGDRIIFASGFTSGAIAILAIAAVLGKLKL